MKAFLSVLLGLMLLASLVGASYATPILQPAQGSGDINACVNLKPNDPNYTALGCAGAAHQNGDENPPPSHGCLAPGQRVPDVSCCPTSRADGTCCVESVAPHSLEVSDIHPDQVCQP